MDSLPNGFTGFAGAGGRPEGFESAAEASRRRRGVAPDAAQSGAPAGSGHAGGAAGRVQPRYRNDEGVPGAARAAHEPPFSEEQLAAVADLEQRWAWTEVDLSAIRHNVAEARRFLQPRCRIMAVVSADGMGHGAVEVAKAALGAGADSLAVSNVAEGAALRRAGISAPVLVMAQPPAGSIPLLLGLRLTPSVYEPDFAVAYGEAADLRGMKAPFHLMLDTGLNCMGVRFDQAREFLFQISFHRALELEGTFTRFATSDLPETLEFQRQARRFVEAVDAMHQAGFDEGVVHCADSATVFRHPEVHFDMVRLGRALYGFNPCREAQTAAELRPALSVHARIVDTRMPAMSEGVAHGLRYRSPGSVKICTIPLGYADGLASGLSGNMDVIMGGRYFRQVGEIGADECVFEVDMRASAMRERIDPQVGDEVLVVGRQGIAEVSIDEMAEKLHVSQAELAIGFARRLARAYR